MKSMKNGEKGVVNVMMNKWVKWYLLATSVKKLDVHFSSLMQVGRINLVVFVYYKEVENEVGEEDVNVKDVGDKVRDQKKCEYQLTNLDEKMKYK